MPLIALRKVFIFFFLLGKTKRSDLLGKLMESGKRSNGVIRELVLGEDGF